MIKSAVSSGSALSISIPGKVADYVTLMKPGISFMVSVSAVAGYVLGSRVPLDVAMLFKIAVGTFLSSAGAGALNMWVERDTDALMLRTRSRPIPAGRLTSLESVGFGIALCLLGILYLCLTAGPLSGLVALSTAILYLFAYTPLKRRTWLCVAVGAVPGALPPLIGWTAARGDAAAGAWILFGLIFLWQFPHFLSLAWMYRRDYERAGLPMLSVLDETGSRSALYAVSACALLLVAAFAAAGFDLISSGVGIGLGVLSWVFLTFALVFWWQKSEASARALFLSSVVYLPAALTLITAQKVLHL